jgi:hypothetical protein
MIFRVHRPRLLLMALVATVVTVGFGPPVVPVDAALTSRLPDLAVVPPFDFRLEISSSGRRLLRFST